MLFHIDALRSRYNCHGDAVHTRRCVGEVWRRFARDGGHQHHLDRQQRDRETATHTHTHTHTHTAFISTTFSAPCMIKCKYCEIKVDRKRRYIHFLLRYYCVLEIRKSSSKTTELCNAYFTMLQFTTSACRSSWQSMLVCR